MTGTSFLKSYRLSLVLVGSVIVGSVVGLIWGPGAETIQPLGDIFLNALYTSVVPLIFFSIASAVAGMAGTGRLGKTLGWMLVVFVITGLISSTLMMIGVQLFPPGAGVHVTMEAGKALPGAKPIDVLTIITVPDFVGLLSKRNVLALIVFAVFVGLATTTAGEKGRPFAAFLHSANEVFIRLIGLIMYYAPVGLAAYFAVFVGKWGPELLSTYLRAMLLYYPMCIAYFLVFFTLYAWLAGRGVGVRRFWKNAIAPSMMAAASGSSFATIPLNLPAARKVGVPEDISEVVIPIGATIHMDGSCLAAVLKIALLFNLYGMDFTQPGVILTAIAVAILSGTVMSGVPQGGFTGEILIVTMYGFDPGALVIISLIGTLVDPPATMVNSVGDNVASMLVARITRGRDWLKNAMAAEG